MTYRRLPKYDARKYRCAIFPWLKARHIHHTTYKGPEVLWLDLLPLSVPAHWLVHGILGGSLWMKKAVTRQNQVAKRLPCPWLWRYPNPAQRLFHLWPEYRGQLKWVELRILLDASFGCRGRHPLLQQSPSHENGWGFVLADRSLVKSRNLYSTA